MKKELKDEIQNALLLHSQAKRAIKDTKKPNSSKDEDDLLVFHEDINRIPPEYLVKNWEGYDPNKYQKLLYLADLGLAAQGIKDIGSQLTCDEVNFEISKIMHSSLHLSIY